jgi:cell division protein FtsI/penicillin-binding protein 2
MQTMRSYNELIRPLLGSYRRLRNGKNLPLEKHLAAAFYPVYGFGYTRSHGYRQAASQGSIFKIVTAYEALVQRYKKLSKENPTMSQLNPFEMVDEVYRDGNHWYVGYTLDEKPIPQVYHGGRLPRSQAKHIGRIDLLKALETSSNPYFSLLAGEVIEHPQDLANAAKEFSYGVRTSIDLPYEIAGKVPDNLEKDRTGLYAFAIGQGAFVTTPLQTAVMLSTIANGGKVLKPKIVSLTAGLRPKREENQIPCPPEFDYQEDLSLIGIDFPLFTSISMSGQKSLIKPISTVVKHTIFFPEVIRKTLLIGMKRVVKRTQEHSIGTLSHLYRNHPEAIRDLQEVSKALVGKTSTAESVETVNLDLQMGTNLYTHVWFGGISFEEKSGEESFENPELVVVVYLRFGGFGKEALPIAAQIVKKWREIKKMN